MDINIFFARIRAALATLGPSTRLGQTDLLTSLREESTGKDISCNLDPTVIRGRRIDWKEELSL